MRKEKMCSKKLTQGFTLLELLVVVLIIGILAAIALPQYKKLVEKSKATQALTLLESLFNSALVYQLTTGEYPTSIGQLDIEIPPIFETDGEWKLRLLSTDSGVLGVELTRTQGKYAGTGFAKYQEHPYGSIPKKRNLCIERHKYYPYVFTGEPGDYCKKIFQGKARYVLTQTWTDVYLIP